MGGLGIHLVRAMWSNVDYVRRDGRNHLVFSGDLEAFASVKAAEGKA